MSEELGCGDHGCVFEKPTGMGTNGGCRCLMDVRDPSVRVPLRRKIVAQRETIREQRAEIERLRKANADAFDSGFRRGTCENNPIWPETTND